LKVDCAIHDFPSAMGRQKPYLCCLHAYNSNLFFDEIFANFTIKKKTPLYNSLAQYLGLKKGIFAQEKNANPQEDLTKFVYE